MFGEAVRTKIRIHRYVFIIGFEIGDAMIVRLVSSKYPCFTVVNIERIHYRLSKHMVFFRYGGG